MNNEEIKTPEVTSEDAAVTPEAPVEAPVEAPAAAPAATPAATPVRAPIANPHKYFLLSNIFRSVTVVLLIACTIMSMFLPVFTVNASDDPEDAISFSIMDVIGDLGDEFKLCFTLDPLEDPEDLKELAKIYKNPGKFTQAIDATILANPDNSSPLKDMVKSFEDTRALILIPYFFLLMPVIFIIGLAISALIRLIQVIIGWVTPSTQVKKTDASSCIVVTVFIAICYLVHFFYSCFTLNFVSVGILAAVSVGAVVMNILYRKHTKDIVDAQFGL